MVFEGEFLGCVFIFLFVLWMGFFFFFRGEEVFGCYMVRVDLVVCWL